jgi:hypothetical protein
MQTACRWWGEISDDWNKNEEGEMFRMIGVVEYSVLRILVGKYKSWRSFERPRHRWTQPLRRF